ncbi:MAG: ABC transporter ATP-binding protein, partial [Lachnospiraceae bacterium]|nr:ABC transporter ATP-binding protein [Lachnospiraceae bacterium]
KEIKKPGSDRGFAFQGSNLFPWLTVEKNIAFGLKARHIYKDHKKDVEEYIKLVGLTGFEKSYPHQLSGGMQQRASLARALVGHPNVLLLDEPLGALDAFTRMNLQDEILNIWKEHNMTMLMVTHDVDEAVYMSDYVVVMSARPSKVEAIIKIDLPRPRARAQDTFQEYRTKILKVLDLGGKVEDIEYYL